MRVILAANVMGYFDEQMETWKGHVGAKITCMQFYETHPARNFVRGAKWSLTPTGGPLNAALPTRAGHSVSRALLDFNIARATESFTEAGAYQVETEALMRYSGWHLLGTARMGTDPQTSVVDGYGQAHDVPNLYIIDGSVFVTSGAVNPTSTISALALRATEHLIENRRLQRIPA